MSIQIGQEIGKYKILRKLGEGGFGAVYQAEHVLMKRLCAFKTLHQAMSADERVASRFKREGQVAARFKHPNAIEVYDFDRMPDGTFFIAMEFLAGETLRDRYKRECPLPLPVAIEVIAQVLAALGAAHRGGVVHRDLKPENIFLEKREESPHFVKVLDFGIAKLKEISLGGHGEHQAAQTVATQEGDFFGTPRYASPEQCLGTEVDPRSDLYSAGIVFFEMLTGQLPFRSETPHGYLAQHLYKAPPALREIDAALPEALEPIVKKALEKEPANRYSSAAEMIDALRQAAKQLELGVALSSAALQVRTPDSSTLRRMGIKKPSRLPLFLGVGGAAAFLAVGATALAVLKPWKSPAPPDPGPQPFVATFDPAADAARLKAEAAELSSKLQRFIDDGDFPSALGLLEGRRPSPEAPWIDERRAALAAKLERVEREAEQRLAAARATRAANPQDYDRALLELADVAQKYRYTRSGGAAGDDAEKVRLERDIAAKNAFAELKAAADALAARGELEAAASKMGELPAAFTKTEYGERALQEQKGYLGRAAEHPEAERKAAKELAEAEAALAAAPDELGAAIARVEAIARRYPGVQSGEQAGRRAAALKVERERRGAAEWDTRRARKDAALGAGKLDEAMEACATFPASLSPSSGREAAQQAVEEVRGRAQRLETEARAKAEELRGRGDVKGAMGAIEPFTALKRPELAFVRADAEAALASLATILPLHERMVLVPKGTYTIGSETRANERPAHAVAVEAFFIDVQEVSNADYALFLQDAGSGGAAPVAPPRHWPEGQPPPGEERLPVVQITRQDAEAFCRWAGKRLPTEEEWEAAARGPSGALFPWGGNAWDYNKEPRRALIQRTAGGRKSAVAVDSHDYDDAAPSGVRSLAGNVSEWTSSIFVMYPGNKNPPSPEKEPGQGSYGVVRGGNFMTSLLAVPATFRYAMPRDMATEFVGFRCAKDAR